MIQGLVRAPLALPDRDAIEVVKRGWAQAMLVGGMLGYLLTQVVLYPLTIGIKDESTYLSAAYVLRGGTIFADMAGISIWSGIFHNGHIIPMYPPGQAALLLPAVVFDWHLVFAINLALQLIGFLLFMELLSRFNVRREWALLYLFFPALVLFSRTLMTEVPSATLMLLALLLYFRGGRSRVAAGVLFGLLAFLAYKNLIPFSLLLASALIRDAGSAWAQRHAGGRLRWTNLNSINLLVGFFPISVFLAAYNLYAFGRLLGYGNNGFGLGYVLPNLGFYALDLLILFPLMLLAPLLYRGPRRLEVIFLTFGVLIATSAYYYIDNVHGFAENLLTGARLLLPVMPLWLLAYASVLDRLFSPARLFRAAVAGVAIAGALLCVAVSFAHQQHLRQAAAVRGLIYERTAPQDVLIIDDETAKFIAPAWGNRRYVFLGRPDAAALLASPPPSVAIVFTTQGNIDVPAYAAAQTWANGVAAERLFDRSVGDWRLVIWERGPRGSQLAAEHIP